ncbi:uncharacterized protein [Antedon mediterranea]|uniref:uncharacterized protein n=1 Tax=Antedon mediterranea TaxID=105859 RepID=UPI003AF8277B
MDGLASYDSDSSEISADLRAQENLYKRSFEYGIQRPGEHMKSGLGLDKIDVYPSPPRLVSREEYTSFTKPNDGNYDSPPLLSRSDSPPPKDEAEHYMKAQETNGTEVDMPGTSKLETVAEAYSAAPVLTNIEQTNTVDFNNLYNPTDPTPENSFPIDKECRIPFLNEEEMPEIKENLNEPLATVTSEATEYRSPSKEYQSRSRSCSRSIERKSPKKRSPSRSKRSRSREGRSRSRISRSKSREKVHKSRSNRSRSKGRRSRSRGRRSRSKGTSRRRSRSGSRIKSSRRRSRSRSKGSRRRRSRSRKRKRRSRSHERRRKYRSGSNEHSSRRKSSRPMVDEFGRDLSSRKRSVSPAKARTSSIDSKVEKKQSPLLDSPKKPISSDENSDSSRSPSRERAKVKNRRERDSISPKRKGRRRSPSQSPPRRNSRSSSPKKRHRLRSSRSRTPKKHSRSRSPRRKSRSRSPGKRRYRRSHSRSPKRKRRDDRRRRSRSPRPHRDRRSRSKSPFSGRGGGGGGRRGGYDSAIHAQEALARRLEKAKKMQDQKRKELEESAANEPKKSADDIAKALSAHAMTGANAQVAFQAAYAELQAKALATTGIAVPSYYNPMAVNPLQYAAKAKKRQLLWSSKKVPVPEETEEITAATTTSSNKWEKTSFGDAATKEKFRRLMGIKADSADPQDAEVLEQESEREKLFSQLDQEYQVARIKTHTQRSFGLGFGSGVPPPQPPGPSTE